MIIYHGSPEIIRKPQFNGGKDYNDYGKGFYTTFDDNLAREWAVNKNTDGYLNKYELNTKGLKIVNLNQHCYTALNWMALLYKNRHIDGLEKYEDKVEEFIKNFAPDISQADIIIGYRVDDRYFGFGKLFASDRLSLQSLEDAVLLGNLGQQIFLRSKEAFSEKRLEFRKAEPVKSSIWHTVQEIRKEKAINTFKKIKVRPITEYDITMRKILEGDGWKYAKPADILCNEKIKIPDDAIIIKAYFLMEKRMNAIYQSKSDNANQENYKAIQLTELKKVAEKLCSISSENAGQVVCVQSPDLLPDKVREELGKSLGESAGVYDPETDVIFLVADNIESPERAVSVWAHEQLVHHGLRSLFTTDERNDLLDQIWEQSGGLENKEMALLAERYGVDAGDEESRRFLSEEYLACLAEKRASDLLADEESLWEKIVQFVKEAIEKICKLVTGKSPDEEVVSSNEVDELLTSLGRHVIDGLGKPRGAVVTETARPALREKPAPENVFTAYKLFRVDADKPGQLFPLYVKADESVPMGVWIDAEIGPEAAPSKTGRKQVKSKLGKLAFRPGWHAGDAPCMYQVGSGKLLKKKVNGEEIWQRERRDENHVWAEVKVAADVSYQEEADKNGINPRTGNFVNRDADIKRIPEDGFYRYKTSPTMRGKWIISGSMKIERVLTDSEVESLNKKTGWPDLPRKKPLELEQWGFSSKTGLPLKLQNSKSADRAQEIVNDNKEILKEWSRQSKNLAMGFFETALCFDPQSESIFLKVCTTGCELQSEASYIVIDRRDEVNNSMSKSEDLAAKIVKRVEEALLKNEEATTTVQAPKVVTTMKKTQRAR